MQRWFAVRACFENIPAGLAAGRGVWLRCSSVTDFLANMRPCRASPSSPPRSQSLPDLFSKHALRILAALLIFLTGCSSTRRPVDKPHDAEDAVNEASAPMENEHITESPTLAPPPGTAASPVNPTAIRPAAGGWVPLKRWSAENNIGPVQQISAGPVPAFALRAPTGLLIVRENDLVAYWNSMQFHLGFPPQLIDNQLVVYSLDLAKNIQPLLRPLALPPNSNRIIVIDPGHGGSNLGTRSVFNGAREKEYTLDWARRLAPILTTNGWRVFLTRTSDVDLSLTDRVMFAEARHASLFVSLHFNAMPSEDDEEAGVETYCVTPAGMPSTLKRDFEDDASLVFPNNRFDPENLQYAMQVQHSLLKITGARDHGVRRARFMTVLRGQNRPAILVEGGYLSNPREAKHIAEPAYRQKLAEAVAAALVEKPPARTPATASETKTSARSVAKSNFRNGGANLPVCHDSRQGIATISEITFGKYSKNNAPAH